MRLKALQDSECSPALMLAMVCIMRADPALFFNLLFCQKLGATGCPAWR